VAELKDQGHRMGRQRVRTLMKLADLQAIQPKSFVPQTTDSQHGKGYWPNLLLDRAVPVKPNLVWVSNITYLPLVGGEWAYLGACGAARADGFIFASDRGLASR
jgi:putative transposase